MAGRAHTIELRVVGATGDCAAGHRVGDRFLVRGDCERFSCDGICIHALYSLMPKLIALRYGARFPWAADGDEIRHACPDATNPHVFALRRVD
ncbi:MAG: TIGR04076 family protein [Candidatus Bipolaricaulota bacterium]|nr:MAG: TIGR04076 family protein [Candidatus Bipolaricaulota bacterium]